MAHPEEDADRFAARVMAPSRAGLAAALEQLTGAPPRVVAECVTRPAPFSALLSRLAGSNMAWRGHVSPREAFEAMAPEAWLSDRHRRFVDDLGRAVDTPPTLSALVALGADWQGVVTAEAVADALRRSLCERFDTLSNRSGEVTLCWRVVDPRRWRARCQGRGVTPGLGPAHWSSLVAAIGPPAEAIAAAEARRERVLSQCVATRSGVSYDAAEVAFWASLARAERGAHPFVELESLWSLGYALDRFEDGVMTLAAPAL